MEIVAILIAKFGDEIINLCRHLIQLNCRNVKELADMI